MKTSLEHLPAHKAEQLAAITELFRKNAPVDLLILFGSYARGDWVDDFVNGYFSDYDLLVVVTDPQLANDTALWVGLESRAKALAGRVPVTLLVHDVKELNREIRSGQYFFSDIVAEGVVLYDSRRLQLAKTRAGTPRARLELAQKNLRYWFSSATAFWQGSRFYADQLLLSHGAFLLHQAAERYFHALLLVFTGYKPKTHDLEQLLLQVVRLEPALAGAIATAEPRQDELFQLLRRAYIEARYSKSYEISADELAELRTRVHELSRRVLRACTERLATFCGAEAVGPLPEVPVDVDYRQEPPAAAKDDPEAMRRWASLVIHMYETRAQQEALLVGEARGREKGRVEGRREGIEQGLREGEVRGRRRSQARAIVDVLQRRGVELSSGDAQRILSCREESLLARYWDRAFSVDSVRELFDKE